VVQAGGLPLDLPDHSESPNQPERNRRRGLMFVAGLNLVLAQSLAHRRALRVYSEDVEFPPLQRFGALFKWLIWGACSLRIHRQPMGHEPLARVPARAARACDGIADRFSAVIWGSFFFNCPTPGSLPLALITVIVCLLSSVFLYLVEGGVWITPRGQ